MDSINTIKQIFTLIVESNIQTKDDKKKLIDYARDNFKELKSKNFSNSEIIPIILKDITDKINELTSAAQSNNINLYPSYKSTAVATSNAPAQTHSAARSNNEENTMIENAKRLSLAQEFSSSPQFPLYHVHTGNNATSRTATFSSREALINQIKKFKKKLQDFKDNNTDLTLKNAKDFNESLIGFINLQKENNLDIINEMEEKFLKKYLNAQINKNIPSGGYLSKKQRKNKSKKSKSIKHKSHKNKLRKTKKN